MTRLIFVRHGETLKNVKGVVHDVNDLENLTEIGILQIKKLSDSLKKFNPDKLYCSGEIRANESARIISESLNLEPNIISDLKERNWGKYVGHSFSEIKEIAKMDNMNFEERYTFKPPGGESWKETEERLVKSLNAILDTDKGKTIIIVTHGGSIRTLMPILLGVDRTESYKYDPDNASVTIFDYNKGKFSRITYNDTHHLEN